LVKYCYDGRVISMYASVGPLRGGTERTSYPGPGGPESHKPISLSCRAQLLCDGPMLSTSEDFLENT